MLVRTPELTVAPTTKDASPELPAQTPPLTVGHTGPSALTHTCTVHANSIERIFEPKVENWRARVVYTNAL